MKNEQQPKRATTEYKYRRTELVRGNRSNGDPRTEKTKHAECGMLTTAKTKQTQTTNDVTSTYSGSKTKQDTNKCMCIGRP